MEKGIRSRASRLPGRPPQKLRIRKTPAGVLRASNCPDDATLRSYRDDELAGRTSVAVQNHVADCPTCLMSFKALCGL